MEQKSGKRGRMIMWCSSCERFIVYDSDDTFKNVCRKCGERMNRRKCTRCGHEWVPSKFGGMAKKCPKCKSPYWNRERMA